MCTPRSQVFPKKRTFDRPSIYECDLCKVVLQAKYMPIHKECLCSVDKENLVYPYIQFNALYTYVEAITFEDIPSLKSLTNSRLHDFVFLSTTVMKLMKLSMGDPVVISPRNCEEFIPFTKNVWPIYGKNYFVAYTSIEVLSTSDSMKNVKIYPMRNKIQMAQKIVVKSEIENFQMDLKFLTKLKNQNLNNVFCLNNKLKLAYYGKLITVNIIKIEPLSRHKNSAKENLKHENEDDFFLNAECTVWESDKNLTDALQSVHPENEIGGLDTVIKELEEIISLTTQRIKAPFQGLHIPKGILIFGPPGTGKTSLVESLSRKRKMNIMRIDNSQIFNKYLGAEKQLECFFDKARQLPATIILINELDVLCPKLFERNDQAKRIVATLCFLLDKLHETSNDSIVVFATTSKLNDVNETLRRPGRFGKEIEIQVPNAHERKEILNIFLKNISHNLKEADISEISNLCHGFVGADLASLVSKAVLQQFKLKQNNVVTVKDFHCALAQIKPSAMREVLIEVPKVKWSDIGGQEELKLKLKQAIEWPLKYKDSFKRLGIIPPRGLLMFGPPGCSKTMIAKALATESKLNFLSVKGPELFSKWVGESEKAVREVFRRARQVAPSIIFFDELDAFGGKRNYLSDGANVEERVLAQLLTELDGVEPLENVTVVGATNRLDRIDPALLRPGRFDRIVHVSLPDSETRRQIFSIQFKNSPIFCDVNVGELIEKTEGFSGAEVVAVCHEAAINALEENLASSCIYRKHFLKALDIVIARTSSTLTKG